MISARKVKQKNYDLIVLSAFCILCNLYKIVFSAGFSSPGLQTSQDIFSTLYSSAYFGGKDWSIIGREYSAYYGYGFFIFFSWLFRLTNDGLLIYRIILIICNLLNVVSCIFCYKIAGQFKLHENKYLIYMLCIASTSILGTSGCGITNEYPLNVCVWAVLYVLIKLCNPDLSKRKRIINTLALGGLLAYSCTVHARAAVLYFLAALCIMVISIRQKKCIIHIPSMICTCLLFIPYKLYTGYLQVELLGEINANSSVILKAANGMKGSFSWDMVYTFLLSVMMYIHELNVLTAGMTVVCIAAVLYAAFRYLRKKASENIGSLRTNILICGLVFSIGGIGVFLLGMCFSCRMEIYRGITVPINSHLRYLTLVRYFMPFVGPFVFMTILLLITYHAESRRIISSWSLLVLFLMQLFFLCIIYPAIKFTGWANSVYLPYTWDAGMERDIVYLAGGIIIPFYICFLCIWQLRKSNWYSLCIVIFLFSTLGISYRYMHQYTECNEFVMVDGGYEYLKRNSETEDIYVAVELLEDGNEEENRDETTYYFLYQLLLPQLRIIPGEPDENVQGVKILTNDPHSVQNSSSYEIIQLDDNEWLLKR